MAWWESSDFYVLGVAPYGGRQWWTSPRNLTRTEARDWQAAAYDRQGRQSRVTLWRLRAPSSMLENRPVYEYLGALG